MEEAHCLLTISATSTFSVHIPLVGKSRKKVHLCISSLLLGRAAGEEKFWAATADSINNSTLRQRGSTNTCCAAVFHVWLGVLVFPSQKLSSGALAKKLVMTRSN